MLGRTVHEIEYEMTHEEVIGWFEYFRRRPLGWREDQRTYMLLSALGTKARPEELFSSLTPSRGPTVEVGEGGEGGTFAQQFFGPFLEQLNDQDKDRHPGADGLSQEPAQ